MAKGGAIKAVCQRCGRVAYFDPNELLRYYRRRNWDRSWPDVRGEAAVQAAGRLRSAWTCCGLGAGSSTA